MATIADDVPAATLPGDVIARIAASLPNDGLVGPMRLVCKAWCEGATLGASHLQPSCAITAQRLRKVVQRFRRATVLDLRGCEGLASSKLAQDAGKGQYSHLTDLSFDDALWNPLPWAGLEVGAAQSNQWSSNAIRPGRTILWFEASANQMRTRAQ